MIKRTLKLGIGPDNLNDWDAIERVNKSILPLMQPLLGKKEQPRDFSIDLDSKKIPQWVEVLTEILKAKKLAKVGYARLEEKAVETKDRPAEWFELDPRTWLEHEGNTPEGVNFIKADRVKPGVHVASLTAPPYVSEQFRALVGAEKLRGLDFVWMPDKGRTRGAMQWYLAVAEKPLGRGLDHDWFDPGKLPAAEGFTWGSAKPGWRAGVVFGDPEHLKRDVSLGRADLDELLALLPRDKRYVRGVRRFLRAFLPSDVDFAFTWRTPDRQDAPGGYLRCSRELAVSRRAMEQLVAAGLVTPKEFVPIEILDEPPPGVEVLDRAGDKQLPGKLFDGEWRTRIDAREKELRGGLDQKAAPMKKSALPVVLKRLSVAQHEDAENFSQGASAAELAAAAAKLKVALPMAWRAVLMVSNGFTLSESEAVDGADCRFEPAKKLAGEQKRALDYLKLVWEEKPSGLLYIGDTIFGDFFFLRVGDATAAAAAAAAAPDDAAAVLVSHETGEDLANWPSVAAMLEELLAAS